MNSFYNNQQEHYYSKCNFVLQLDWAFEYAAVKISKLFRDCGQLKIHGTGNLHMTYYGTLIWVTLCYSVLQCTVMSISNEQHVHNREVLCAAYLWQTICVQVIFLVYA